MSDSPIEKMILSDGFLRNEQLKRKWIIGQIYKYYITSDTKNDFTNHFFKNKPYSYVWTVLLREIKMFKKIEKSRNLSEKEKRQNIRKKEIFINRSLILNMLNDYDEQSDHNDHNTTEQTKIAVKTSRSYANIEKHIAEFLKKTNPSKYKNFRKPDMWQNAFIGNGLYCTLADMIKYQGYRFSENESMYESLQTLDKLMQKHKTDFAEIFFSDALKQSIKTSKTLKIH